MENKMEHEMETGVILGLYWGYRVTGMKCMKWLVC